MNWGNELKYAYRALKANRLCSRISVVGLGIGLACVTVMATFVFQTGFTGITTGCIIAYRVRRKSSVPVWVKSSTGVNGLPIIRRWRQLLLCSFMLREG